MIAISSQLQKMCINLNPEFSTFCYIFLGIPYIYTDNNNKKKCILKKYLVIIYNKTEC